MEEETIQKGIIAGISGHPMSGLWNLHFEDGKTILIESGYGVRNLASCFGATEGTGDLQKKIKGQTIFYTADAFNVLCGFTPEKEATPEIINRYEKKQE